MADEALWLHALKKSQIFVDPRKFREYVLVPGHSSGKDRVFLELLGYRPNSADDAIALARLYEDQARQRIMLEDVEFAGVHSHGRRYVIVIVVRDVALRTGWLLGHDGSFWLTTPFRGFARTKKQRFQIMRLPQFCAVRLTTSRFLHEGVGVGAIGFILDVYDDGYDVEFSRPEDGATIALLFLTQADIVPAPEVVLRSEHASV